jgi:hypothetical protein
MRLAILATTALLAACSQEAEAPKKAAAPATIPPGEYEVTATVKSLRSTDKTAVPTFAKQGDTRTVRGCVRSDGLPAPELLAARGDSCTIQNPFVSNGRMNFQLNCNRPGSGNVMSDVTGTFTADGFTGTLISTSFFAASGDYRLEEDITARKIADQCTATGGAAGAPKA